MKIGNPLILLTLPLMLALSGCFAQRPPIEIVRVEVIDESPAGTALLTTLAVKNPWDEPIAIGPIEWTLKVGDQNFTDTDAPPVSLPADGVQIVKLRSALPVPPPTGDCTIKGKLTYTPPGDFRIILTETGFPLPKADFHFSGSTDTAQTP